MSTCRRLFFLGGGGGGIGNWCTIIYKIVTDLQETVHVPFFLMG